MADDHFGHQISVSCPGITGQNREDIQGAIGAISLIAAAFHHHLFTQDTGISLSFPIIGQHCGCPATTTRIGTNALCPLEGRPGADIIDTRCLGRGLFSHRLHQFDLGIEHQNPTQYLIFSLSLLDLTSHLLTRLPIDCVELACVELQS